MLLPFVCLPPYVTAVIYDGSVKALPYGGIYGRAMPRPSGRGGGAADGEGIFPPYGAAITSRTNPL
ncbi:MAG: hypothetical protein IJ457_08650 [Clostridia bacterium]|nr:hypothetical protein [Clostridia bacterium]